MRFVAFLRGVNVGGAKRVAMADLRALLEGLGYTGVKTLLNSGNAVFESSGRAGGTHAKKIEKALSDELGLQVLVIVKSAAEIAAVIEENHIPERKSDPTKLLAAFTSDANELRDLSAIEPLVHPPDKAQAGKHAFYLYTPAGISKSKASEALLGKAGRAATTRNWATVLKVYDLLTTDN